VGAPTTDAEPARTLVLSIDLEDWHQLVGRRYGLDGWDRPHPVFEEQTRAVLELLDELGVTATFFVLGMTARNHPAVVREVAARGHEVACHGFAHERVYGQTAEAFRDDLVAALELIEELAGVRPLGYRAPAFSINRDTPWAYDVLAELGFAYDSSLYDSPRIPRRIQPVPPDAHPIAAGHGGELWEFPVATWSVAGRTLPIGGGGYWRFLPTGVILRGLGEACRAASHPVIYCHPYECDPRPLRAEIPPTAAAGQRLRAAGRAAYRNAGGRRMIGQLRRVAQEFRLVTYEQLFREDPRLGRTGAGPLPPPGASV
jgi:polysaccharide deacetylase family protein (PEP-CTERM system associated)